MTSHISQVDTPHNADGNECGSSDDMSEIWSWKLFFKYSGSGFLIAIAYLDPGNLEADLQAGSYSKYKLLWVLLYSLVIGLILQNMAVRIGVVTGKHLAQVCREEYSPIMAKALWMCAELSIVACDVQAVITSAIALRILFGWDLWVGCIVTAIDAFTFLMLDALGVRSLETFFVLLVAMMAVCFFWNFSVNPPSPEGILFGMFIPTVNAQSVKPAVGIIGSLILPQNYFLHSALVLERPINRSSSNEIRAANKYMTADTVLALLVAFLINTTVVSCFAELFFDTECQNHACVVNRSDDEADIANMRVCHHDHEEGVCESIGLSGAGSALSGALGGTASLIWALGLLASGQSSTMTITYAGQFIMEGFAEMMPGIMPVCIQLKIPLYWRVLFCRLTALIPALMAALAHATYPESMDDVTQWGNIIASLCVPFSILPMLRFCNSSRVMGEHTMHFNSAVCMWIVTICLILTNFYLLWSYGLSISSVSIEVTTPILCIVTIGYAYLSYKVVDVEVNDFVAGLIRKHALQGGVWKTEWMKNPPCLLPGDDYTTTEESSDIDPIDVSCHGVELGVTTI